ncbi:MAG TPA: isoaspartyl peptidase/L-asparaginase family protein [Burkholderiales bacterium]|nr:isoaspartyl peptidase/L-asparaginase family protein [Burkholderiales bacterium]
MRWAIAVHGGAGDWDVARHAQARAGVSSAAQRGGILLAGGGAALDAVTAAVAALEDDPSFNAGTGSVLNRDGEVEMDAAVMTGHDLAFGAVAAIRRVRNPVLVARCVMERSGHALLAGEGAVRFAREQGFGDYDPVTAGARAAFERARADLRLGTVGAVALDSAGRLAAATSTGGVLLKLAGRVGDTPLPGAGTYATQGAAVSATGKGELMMRVLAAKSICDLAAAGLSAQDAADRVLAAMRDAVGADAGFIAIGRDGSIGMAHGTRHMAGAWWTSEQSAVRATMARDAAGSPLTPARQTDRGRRRR